MVNDCENLVFRIIIPIKKGESTEHWKKNFVDHYLEACVGILRENKSLSKKSLIINDS